MMLSEHYHMGSAVAGGFGIAGAPGRWPRRLPAV
ncbi:MFS transporter, partial [Klebsiella pneumoniae]